ncbi:dephospho-CoA kinase [Macromonas nakdongensis]|uniref:dephospho-CoA kinase n=1 Tax=Macromonas nakdongensis TaxID=1843082 RepID=UPI001E4CA8D8|nr:dephospho-CoA kinase [Macromonas nakdongensis]
MSAPTPPPRPLRLGLTGGIGSGKSTVATLLQDLGATVVDADAISRASTAAGGAAIAAIRAAFGPDFIAADGALDRDRMRAAVFADPSAKQRLEAIVHPLVRAEIERQTTAAAGDCAVLDIPLLVESPTWRERVDTVWVVDCQPETQIRRVVQRNGWPREQVEAVLAAQASRAQRLAVADTVIDNDHATLAQLETRVRNAYAQMRQRFGL